MHRAVSDQGHVCPSLAPRPWSHCRVLGSQRISIHTNRHRFLCIWSSVQFKSLISASWDDWVPEDRLRKLTPENRELANNLRHEMLLAQRAIRVQPPPSKKKAQSSARGSEERQTSVSAAAPRGLKRTRDQELEKVSPHVCICPARLWRKFCAASCFG
jgi:hypothetical protein